MIDRVQPGLPRMGPNHPKWMDRWAEEPYRRIYPGFYVHGYGTDREPHSSHWMASLLDPLGSRFREGVKIIDYGCGAGRLCNFISGHLRDFRYLGTEPAGSSALPKARHYFNDDPRADFADAGSTVEAEAIQAYDTAVLGSIFTHLRPDACVDILDHLMPIVERDGIIVFTAMFEDELRLDEPGAYGFDDCYAVAFQRWEWIAEVEDALGVEICREARFACNGIQDHFIFSINGTRRKQ